MRGRTACGCMCDRAQRVKTMARPSKTVDVLKAEGKSHRTKAELNSRREEEQAQLTGIKMREYPETRESESAHREFARVRRILSSVGKNDAIYEAVMNEYAMLKSDIDRYVNLRKKLEEKLENDEGVKTSDFALLLSYDKQINVYKRRRFDIEKENGMTIASSMRAIPKKPAQKSNPLLEALKDDN